MVPGAMCYWVQGKVKPDKFECSIVVPKKH